MSRKYDVIALGELLVDFTADGQSAQGNPRFEASAAYIVTTRKGAIFNKIPSIKVQVSSDQCRTDLFLF